MDESESWFRKGKVLCKTAPVAEVGDEQRLQLTEEAGYANWQFLYDTAAGIPAVLAQRHEPTHEGGTPTYFVREPGGELLASFEFGGSATYYHFDALGSTVMLSDASGDPDGAYAYGAWGNVLTSPVDWQPYQYVGQLGYYTHHAGQGAEISNWLQLGVRFYQPELGRFERRDPIVLHGEASFAYSGGRVLVYTDPRGFVPWSTCLKNGSIKDADYELRKAAQERAREHRGDAAAIGNCIEKKGTKMAREQVCSLVACKLWGPEENIGGIDCSPKSTQGYPCTDARASSDKAWCQSCADWKQTKCNCEAGLNVPAQGHCEEAHNMEYLKCDAH